MPQNLFIHLQFDGEMKGIPNRRRGTGKGRRAGFWAWQEVLSGQKWECENGVCLVKLLTLREEMGTKIRSTLTWLMFLCG